MLNADNKAICPDGRVSRLTLSKAQVYIQSSGHLMKAIYSFVGMALFLKALFSLLSVHCKRERTVIFLHIKCLLQNVSTDFSVNGTSTT